MSLSIVRADSIVALLRDGGGLSSPVAVDVAGTLPVLILLSLCSLQRVTWREMSDEMLLFLKTSQEDCIR